MARINVTALALALTAAAVLAAPAEGAVVPLAEARILDSSIVWRVDADGRLDAPTHPAAALRDAVAALRAEPEDAAAADAASRALRALAGGPASWASVDASPGFGIANPQGDATGDGLSEALARFYPAARGGSTWGFEMSSPPSTEPLWRVDVEAAYAAAVPAVDLDGDGRTDVLLTILQLAPESTTPLPGGGLSRAEHSWSVRALRGSDGSTMWTLDEDGIVAASGVVAGDLRAQAFAGRAVVFAPLVGPDADGDGGADVWLNVFDAAALAVGDSFNGVGARAQDARVTVLSGASGDALATLAFASGPGGFSVALPAEDLSGDGLADTVVTSLAFRANGHDAAVVTALEGATGRPLWVAPYASFAFGVPVPDLDGDGAADVVVEALEPTRRDAVSGASGDVLWSFEEDYFLWVVPGDVDGAGGADLLFVDADYEPATRSSVARVAAVAGASGATIYEARPVAVTLPTGGYTSISLGVLAGDFDGDGLADTMFNTETGKWPEVYSQDAHAVRAADGAVWWSRPGIALPAGDVSGDGRDDAMEVHLSFEPFELSVTLVDGATANALWSRPVESAALFAVALRPGADFGGSGADDLLVTIVEGESPVSLSTRLEAWDGLGANAWAT